MNSFWRGFEKRAASFEADASRAAHLERLHKGEPSELQHIGAGAGVGGAMGAVPGAALGAMGSPAGNKMRGSGRGALMGAGLGALLGAVLGDAVYHDEEETYTDAQFAEEQIPEARDAIYELDARKRRDAMAAMGIPPAETRPLDRKLIQRAKEKGLM